MLKQLRVKLVCILMSVVTVMLVIILGFVLYSTQRDLTQNSMVLMKNLAAEQGRPGKPNDQTRDMRRQYLTIYLNAHNEIAFTEGGFYDLSDESFLTEVLDTVLSSCE